MNVKFIKCDQSTIIGVAKLKQIDYINSTDTPQAYYLSLLGGEVEWKIGKILTFDEVFKGNKNFLNSGQAYIFAAQRILEIIDILGFDLGTFLRIHELQNIEDLTLLIIHINKVKSKKKKKILLKKRLNEMINYLKLSPPESNKTPQQKKIVEFKDFFKKGTDKNVINNIQETFKNESDKNLAMFIYRLTELELVEITLNSKTKSRKHFVKALTGEKNKDMSFINRTLQAEIKDINGKIHDGNYYGVKNKLDKII